VVAEQADGGGRRNVILAVLCVAMLATSVGNTLLNVAVPTLVRDLRASNSELQWILDSYVLAFAGLLLVAGSLGDRVGRRKVMQVGLVTFILGSLLGALSTSPGQLIASRALLGAGAACIMPLTLSVITNVFTADRDRGRAIAVWSAVATSGGMYGPLLSGWLISHFWWGSVFVVNIPFLVGALIAIRLVVPESTGEVAGRLDVPGIVLSIATPTCLVFGVIEGPERGWTDPVVVLSLAAAAVLAASFAVWELRVEHPLLDVRALRNRTLSVGSGVGFVTYFFLFGTNFLIAQYLVQVVGLTPLETGVRLIPSAVAMTLAAPVAARLVERFGARRVVSGGLAFAGCGLLLLFRADNDSGSAPVMVALAIQGLGVGMAMPPTTSLVMGSLPRAKAGVASAVQNTSRQLGAALGVALVGSLVAARYTAEVVRTLGGEVGEVGRSLGAALAVADELGGAEGAEVAGAARDAFVDALHVGVAACAFLAFAGSLAMALWLPSRAPEEVVEPAPDLATSST
jgi:EmrB/QacA subfamily drug resistance transporter